jgi:hypothetical protein
VQPDLCNSILGTVHNPHFCDARHSRDSRRVEIGSVKGV